MRILVLGAGFGGLELSTQLSEQFGEEIEVVLIDQSGGFVFGFSKLDIMFGRKAPSEVFHPYRDINKPGLRFVQSAIRSIDPAAKRVETDAAVSYTHLGLVHQGEVVGRPPVGELKGKAHAPLDAHAGVDRALGRHLVRGAAPEEPTLAGVGPLNVCLLYTSRCV